MQYFHFLNNTQNIHRSTAADVLAICDMSHKIIVSRFSL